MSLCGTARLLTNGVGIPQVTPPPTNRDHSMPTSHSVEIQIYYRLCSPSLLPAAAPRSGNEMFIFHCLLLLLSSSSSRHTGSFAACRRRRCCCDCCVCCCCHRCSRRRNKRNVRSTWYSRHSHEYNESFDGQHATRFIVQST